MHENDNKITIRIPIVFAFDDKWIVASYVAILSLLENASNEVDYEVIIVNRNLSNKNRKYLVELFRRFRRHHVKFVDLSEELKKQLEGYYSTASFTMDVYLRLFLPDILGEYDKVLYSDTDVVFQGCLLNAYKEVLGDNYFAACIDIPGNRLLVNDERRAVGKEFFKSYFNSGFLLINLKKLRVDQKVVEFARLAGEKFRFVDQDVMNITCFNKIKRINITYNFSSLNVDLFDDDIVFLKTLDIFEEYKIAKNHPVMIHFCGALKPWHIKKKWDRYHKVWWRYAQKLPYILWLKIYTPILIRKFYKVVDRSIFKSQIKGLFRKFVQYDLYELDPYGIKRFFRNNERNKIVVWGAGVTFEQLFKSSIKPGDNILVVDKNAGQIRNQGFAVHYPEEIKNFKPKFIIIACGVSKAVIRENVENFNIDTEILSYYDLNEQS